MQGVTMFAEFKTLWELQQEGSFEQLTYTAEDLRNKIQTLEIDLSSVNEQAIIAIIGVIIVGIIFLPFGATTSSIKKCQVNTNQKVVKLGGALIVVMTSISAILFLEVLQMSELLGSIY